MGKISGSGSIGRGTVRKTPREIPLIQAVSHKRPLREGRVAVRSRFLKIEPEVNVMY
jgi:hypothetical protein